MSNLQKFSHTLIPHLLPPSKYSQVVAKTTIHCNLLQGLLQTRSKNSKKIKGK